MVPHFVAICRIYVAFNFCYLRRPLFQLPTSHQPSAQSLPQELEERAAAPQDLATGKLLVARPTPKNQGVQEGPRAQGPRPLKALKKKMTDLDVYLINFRGTKQPQIFFFLTLF
jgi:hypothetical protein